MSLPRVGGAGTSREIRQTLPGGGSIMRVARQRQGTARAFWCVAAILVLLVLLPPAPAAPPGNILPKFKFKLVDGTVLDSGDLQGKVTVVDFWGTWCAPCLAEIPEYNRFYGEYRNKGVRFLALAADSGTIDEVRAAAKRLKIDYPVAVPTWDELDLFGNLEAFPTTMIFDSKGKLVKEFIGTAAAKHATLRQIVDRLLPLK